MKKTQIFRTANIHQFIVLTVLLCITVSTQAQNWDEVIKITESDKSYYNGYGYEVAISDNYAVVGAYRDATDANGENYLDYAGAAFILKRDCNGSWTEVQKIVASDRKTEDWFGHTVAISEKYVVIGALYGNLNKNGADSIYESGAVYIFELNSCGKWKQAQKIVASDRAKYDHFGNSVAISGDYLVVGSSAEDEDTYGVSTHSNAGSAYIFKRNSCGSWEQTQKIVASDRDINDHFGTSVAISGDYLVVSAYMEGEYGNHVEINLGFAGAAYVFERNNNDIWTEVEKIVASDRNANDQYGLSVAISDKYLIVGANPKPYYDPNGGNPVYVAGAAYIYERDSLGNWPQTQKILASDMRDGQNFAESVAISGDCIIVGAPGSPSKNNGPLHGAGSVYVFERANNGGWAEVQKIEPSDGGSNDYFGNSVSINNGNILVGALWKSSAYIFEYSGNKGCTQNISFSPLKEMEYGNLDQALEATASSGLPIRYITSNDDIASIVNNKVHIIAAGTVTIFAQQAGNDTFAEAPLVSHCLNIKPREIGISARNTTKIMGNSDPELRYSLFSGGLVNGDLISGKLSREKGEDTGIYAIQQGSLTGGHNYSINFIQGSFKITSPSTSLHANTLRELNVYPIPTTDLLNITANKTILLCEIIDLTGKKQLSETINDSSYQLDVSRLNAGMYFIKIYTSEGYSINRIIIE